ncbi:hypothetical protein GC207_09060 [bacterium]|nr:hypothetical protein [bacterium]
METDESQNLPISDPGNDLPEGWEQPTCAVHVGVKPAWRCNSCGQLLCPECVKRRLVQMNEMHFCTLCGGDCESLVRPKKRSARRSVRPKFGPQLADAFAYPLKNNGWGIILGGALVFWLFDLLSHFALGTVAVLAMGFLKLLLAVFGTGYLAAYMFRVIQTSARGDEQLPDWPDLGDITNDLLMPLFRLFGTLLVCFGPAMIIDRWLGADGRGWIYWTVYTIGLLYAPMALIGVAQFESVAAVNPLLVIPSILKTFGHYLIACVVLVVAVIIGSAGPNLVGAIIPWFGGLLSWCVSFYFLFVQMRILGVLYLCHEDELNWFPGINRLRRVKS